MLTPIIRNPQRKPLKPQPAGPTAGKPQVTAHAFMVRHELKKVIAKLEAELAELKASKAPPSAIARQAESATRTATKTLSAARREATPATPQPSSKTMTREAFTALSPQARMAFMKSGGKLSNHK